VELDDLKTQWERLDGRLDASVRLNRRALQGRVLDRAATAVGRLGWALAVELALDVVAVLLTGSFLGDHLREARFLVPAVALHAFVIAHIVILGRQIAATRRIDFAAPLVVIQKRVAALGVARARTTLATLVLAPLLWTPLFVVALKAFGVDAYAVLGIPYLAANVAVGVLVLAAAIVVSRRHGDCTTGRPILATVMRSLSGVSLRSATAHLDAVARFESED
jgi:hypothetical protein